MEHPWMIVGLGNPGLEYRHNRHNVGAWVVEKAQKDWDFPAFRQKKNTLWSQGTTEGASSKAILWIPLSYMNLSALAIMTPFREFPKAHWVVVHDELDLPLGTVRIKKGGGSAGHNGLKSVTSILGPDFIRFRLGISRPKEGISVTQHVLGDFGKRESEVVEEMTQRTICALKALMGGANWQVCLPV